MSRVRVGVIGAGWWSRRVHIPELVRHDAADVVVVCDTDIERAAAAAGECAARAVTTVADVLDSDVDAVVVATPHDQHAAAAQPCLAAGVDVMVEKPMTLEPDSAWRLVETARQSGARLHTGFTFVHGEPARRLRDLLVDGGLGDLTLMNALFTTAVQRLFQGQVDWQRSEEAAPASSLPDTYSAPERGGGQLWAQTIHAISILLWTSGSTPREVSGTFDNAGLAVDVSDALVLGFDTGAVGTIAASGAVRGHERRTEEYQFVGQCGHARLDTVGARLCVVRYDDEPEELRWASDAQANPVDAPVRNLVDARLGRAEVLADGELGAMTTAVAWSAAESARTGRRIPVPAPPPARRQHARS